tara:strand:+ start:82 stop:453 length:372 start_codon:yes stop_codon:yes gene_type:complete
MSIDRLSTFALDKILNGQTNEQATCVVKFYSNDCHYCHALAEYYKEIAEDEALSDLHFFAFNVGDNPSIEKKLKFNGVPTISVIHAKGNEKKSKVKIMPDPDSPNEKTWYYANDIRKFIERER